jgi:hypothetical protein
MVVLCLANLSQPKDAQKSLAILPAAKNAASSFQQNWQPRVVQQCSTQEMVVWPTIQQ